jgi:uncharacterized 2Fe-2S/4Fe-4S cluster protein (DUF4445 family)
MTDALVVFTPSGKRGRFAHGTSLLDAARQLGVDIDSVCGGRAICGRCQCVPAVGSFAKHGIESLASHLGELTPTELRYRERKGLSEGRRLSCQVKLLGDIVVDVPEESQVHRQVVRKRAEAREIRLDPMVRLHFVEVEQPDMYLQRGDFERLREALQREWGLADLTIDLRSLQRLQKALRDGDWSITVAVHDGKRIIALWPGFHDRAYGLAFDIGSTTIAAHLCDLGSGEVLASAGMMNPQIRMGEDLMSRVSYIMMNKGGDTQLTRAVREAVTALVGQVMAETRVEPDEVLEAVFVGNPIMHHLLLGIDPIELGGAPFALATDSPITLWASEIGLDSIHPDARIYVLPCIAGHVGADCAGVVLSEGPHLQDDVMLVVDVGTNAEIVLGNRQKLLACSSPTGPAFEGAQISAGQRAAPGAIERVRIDRDTLEPRFKVIGCDLWSDEPGFERIVARSGVTGICGSGIVEALAELFLSGVILSDGTIDGTLADRSPRIVAEGRTFAYVLHGGARELRITQTDVRAIQLAKAALYAGARLLMDRLGVEHVDRVVLAGAFGSHIDPLYAMVLGLIPDCDLAKVSSAGNAAGTGARIALLNKAARAEIEAVVQRIEKVETAIEPRFQEHFVAAMALPHATAASPNLAKAVTLPERRASQAAEPGARRRRRG